MNDEWFQDEERVRSIVGLMDASQRNEPQAQTQAQALGKGRESKVWIGIKNVTMATHVISHHFQHHAMYQCVRAHVCAYVCVYARVRVRACVCVCERASVHACF